MSTMKLSLLQLLLLFFSLCAMRATSSPLESVVALQQAEGATSRESTQIVAMVGGGEMQAGESPAVTVGAVAGAEDADDASLLMPLLSSDELPARDGKCVELGGFCHMADDCCTLRCLGYAKKCVT